LKVDLELVIINDLVDYVAPNNQLAKETLQTEPAIQPAVDPVEPRALDSLHIVLRHQHLALDFT
jgi:hypothetical protein